MKKYLYVYKKDGVKYIGPGEFVLKGDVLHEGEKSPSGINRGREVNSNDLADFDGVYLPKGSGYQQVSLKGADSSVFKRYGLLK